MECLWLVIETTDFRVLSLYPTSLLNPVISPSSFYVDSLEFPIYRIMSFVINRDSFTFSFPIWMPFFFFLFFLSFFLGGGGGGSVAHCFG